MSFDPVVFDGGVFGAAALSEASPFDLAFFDSSMFDTGEAETVVEPARTGAGTSRRKKAKGRLKRRYAEKAEEVTPSPTVFMAGEVAQPLLTRHPFTLEADILSGIEAIAAESSEITKEIAELMKKMHEKNEDEALVHILAYA